jgi:hypothetical protein
MKLLIAASLIFAASARNLEEAKPDYDAIATYEPYTDVRDQVMRALLLKFVASFEMRTDANRS